MHINSVLSTYFCVLKVRTFLLSDFQLLLGVFDMFARWGSEEEVFLFSALLYFV